MVVLMRCGERHQADSGGLRRFDLPSGQIWGENPESQKAQRTHRARELSGQLRRVIDLPARSIAPSLTFDEEQNGWRFHEKQPGLLEDHHIAAHVRMTAMPDGAVLLVWT